VRLWCVVYVEAEIRLSPYQPIPRSSSVMIQGGSP
jgi:hypothetical protein